jgi:acetyl-CoA synthetase
MLGRAVFGSSSTAVWRPSERDLQRSRLAAAMKKWGFGSLSEFHKASVENPEWFWPAAIEDLGIVFHSPWEKIVDLTDGLQFPKWFSGATLNVAENCAGRHAASPEHADRTAVVYEGDAGQRRSLTFSELGGDVERFAGGLRALGVGKGDRVALFMPVAPEATVALLACAKIGAVAVPAFSGYGPEPLAARLNASEAVALVTVDSTTRRGKLIAMKKTADAAIAMSPSVRTVIVARNGDGGAPMTAGRDHAYADVLARGASGTPTEYVDANHPLLIIYTSGTTGAPKGIVHSHAGYLLKSGIDFGYGFDIQSDDRIGWIADMGWMLGPLMIVGGLQFGAGLVFTEGVPDFPDATRLWRIAERNRVTLQGIAPTAARGVKAAMGGARPAQDLSSLRAFASTGEAWDEPTWRWLFEEVGGSRLPILNYSGGTEVGGGILSCYTMAPQTPATFSGPLPGMDVDVLDASGERADGIGELVIRNIWPGMAHGFWRDPQRYLRTYWDRWPDTWVHGDLASVDAEGYWRIHGRSDDTIKIAGRRVGPAEIESALVTHPGVAEAAAIGVPDPDKGQRIVAFVVLRPDAPGLEESAAGGTVAKAIGKAMVPSAIIEVAGLPKTKNGKIMRRAIRARYLGEPVGDMSALDASTPLELIPTQSGN